MIFFFLHRLSASIDETSFWQFLFVLSSALKAGECSPAQLVVKLHYVLNMAQYLPVSKGDVPVDAVQGPQVKVESGVTVVTQDSSAGGAGSGDGVSVGAETQVRAPLDFTTSSSASSESTAVFSGDMSGASAVVSDLTVEGADLTITSDGPGVNSAVNVVVEPKVEKVYPAVDSTEMEVEVVTVSVSAPVVKAPVQPFSSKLEAIRGFNLFLPVMVGRA